MDFRFQTTIRNFLVQNDLENDYDLVSLAGSSKNLSAVISQVELSYKLHGATNVHIFHHEECGAYGLDKSQISEEQEIEIHKKDMEKTREEILKIVPSCNVFFYFVKLDKQILVI